MTMAVPLSRYVERIGYGECAFWGIRNSEEEAGFACREVWTLAERNMLMQALLEAQDLIELELHYPLVPRWIEAERHLYRPRVVLRWGQVIAAGIESDVMLSEGEAVDYSADPAAVGPVALGDCDADDVHVFHAGTDTEIEIESYVYDDVTGEITLYIPWCRLVDPSYADNPQEGWEYADVATWGAKTVDVRCISNDTSVQATMIWRSTTSCGANTESACVYVRRGDLGVVEVRRADYSDGTWTIRGVGCDADLVEVNYLAGLQEVPRAAEDAVIRLAHSLMPDEPCGCDVTQRLWKRDREEPAMLTAERINCPFGVSNGAWAAWTFVRGARLLRGGML